MLCGSQVWSRVHMLVLDDHRGVEPVLVPGGDMFNAAPPSSAQESAVSFTTVDEQGAAKGHFECVSVSLCVCSALPWSHLPVNADLFGCSFGFGLLGCVVTPPPSQIPDHA